MILHGLKTRKPIWSDDLEAWTMDFHGRVKLASKKNFLLVSENAPTDVLMLFGKVAKSTFSLDYKAPLTVMQALCGADQFRRQTHGDLRGNSENTI